MTIKHFKRLKKIWNIFTKGISVIASVATIIGCVLTAITLNNTGYVREYVKNQIEINKNVSVEEGNINADDLQINTSGDNNTTNTNSTQIFIVNMPPAEAAPDKWEINKIESVASVDGTKNIQINEIANKNIILCYESDDELIIFYGMLDINGYRDGNCIINIYKNNGLASITEAGYDHGKIRKYTQLFPSKTMRGNEVWTITRRENPDNFGYGENWNYYRYESVYEPNKVIESKNIQTNDIITIDDFKKEKCVKIEAYYLGNIIDGKYSDESGNAYIAKYVDDNENSMRTLYKGNFSEGTFNDDTGTAWEIVYDPDNEDSKYTFYKGKFTDGTADDPKNFKLNLTEDFIKNYIDKEDFECPLNWNKDRFYTE